MLLKILELEHDCYITGFTGLFLIWFIKNNDFGPILSYFVILLLHGKKACFVLAYYRLSLSVAHWANHNSSQNIWDLIFFSIVSIHNNWNEARLASPEVECTSCLMSYWTTWCRILWNEEIFGKLQCSAQA